MPKVLVLKGPRRHVRTFFFGGRFGAKFWPEKTTSRDGCVLLIQCDFWGSTEKWLKNGGERCRFWVIIAYFREKVCHFRATFGWMQLFCLQLEASCLQLSFFAYSCFWELFLLTVCLQLSFLAYSGKVCLRSTVSKEARAVSKKARAVSKKGFPQLFMLEVCTNRNLACKPALLWHANRSCSGMGVVVAAWEWNHFTGANFIHPHPWKYPSRGGGGCIHHPNRIGCSSNSSEIRSASASAI